MLKPVWKLETYGKVRFPNFFIRKTEIMMNDVKPFCVFWFSVYAFMELSF